MRGSSGRGGEIQAWPTRPAVCQPGFDHQYPHFRNRYRPAKGYFPYDGNMWQPQIWSFALTGPQILNLYSNQMAGKPWP